MTSNTVKLLSNVALIIQFIGAVLLSMGILKPEIIRKSGERLQKLIYRKRDNLFLQRSFMKVFDSELNGNFETTIEKCFIELTAIILTCIISLLITAIGMLLLAIWCFILYFSKFRSIYFLMLSVLGLLLSISCIIVLFESRLQLSKSEKFKRTRGFILKISKLFYLIYPIYWLVLKIVSVFVLTIPLVYYKSVKKIHNKGTNWAYAIIGVLFMFLSLIMQIFINFLPSN